MTDPEQPRWHRTFDSYRRALALLAEAVDLAERRDLSELEKAGLIQRYENAWETAWKTLADYLRSREIPDLARTPGSAIRGARTVALIDDGDAWFNAGKLRNVLSHEYGVQLRDEGLALIRTQFLPMMQALLARLDAV